MRVLKLFLLFFCFSSSLAFGWGDIGHRTVAQIAETHLTSRARQAVQALLGNESLARASTWADEMRSNPDPLFKKFEPWHYLKVPDGKPFLPYMARPNGDVLWAVESMEKKLQSKDTKKEDRIEALRLLVHFVGDLHQPLHVSQGSDEGATRCQVLWFGDPTTLHRVWDEKLIESLKLSYKELVDFINFPSPQDITTWQKSLPITWAEESFQARPTVYPPDSKRYCAQKEHEVIARKNMPALSYPYLFEHRALLEKRLLQAGVRLAGLLNQIFE